MLLLMISEHGDKKESSTATLPACAYAAAPQPASSEMALAIEMRMFMGTPSGLVGIVGLTWWCKVIIQHDRYMKHPAVPIPEETRIAPNLPRPMRRTEDQIGLRSQLPAASSFVTTPLRFSQRAPRSNLASRNALATSKLSHRREICATHGRGPAHRKALHPPSSVPHRRPGPKAAALEGFPEPRRRKWR